MYIIPLRDENFSVSYCPVTFPEDIVKSYENLLPILPIYIQCFEKLLQCDFTNYKKNILIIFVFSIETG